MSTCNFSCETIAIKHLHQYIWLKCKLFCVTWGANFLASRCYHVLNMHYYEKLAKIILKAATFILAQVYTRPCATCSLQTVTSGLKAVTCNFLPPLKRPSPQKGICYFHVLSQQVPDTSCRPHSVPSKLPV